MIPKPNTATLTLLVGLLVGLLFLTACQPMDTRPDSPEAETEQVSPEQLWQQRQNQLKHITGWQTRGRIGVVTPENGWHASLNWDQQADAYQIQLNGPTGQGIAALYGNKDGITLMVPDEGVASAKDPETLLERQLGFRLPVSGLRYWALGLPSPTPEKTEILDDQGRLKELKQDQWHILLRDYRDQGGFEIPTKLRLERQDMSVKLILRDWSLHLLGQTSSDVKDAAKP